MQVSKSASTRLSSRARTESWTLSSARASVVKAQAARKWQNNRRRERSILRSDCPSSRSNLMNYSKVSLYRGYSKAHTSMQAFSNLTSSPGCISAQYLIDRLYAFFENHSNSTALNCSRVALLGLRRDSFALRQAWKSLAHLHGIDGARTSIKDYTELSNNVSVQCSILDQS